MASDPNPCRSPDEPATNEPTPGPAWATPYQSVTRRGIVVVLLFVLVSVFCVLLHDLGGK